MEKKNKGNILFLLGVYPGFGGTEKVTTILADELSRRGYGIHLASFVQKDMELMDELDSNISFHALTKPINTGANRQKLRNILLKHQVDIIMNQWCLPYNITRLLNQAREGLDCRLVSVLHGVPDRSKKVIVAEDTVKAAQNSLRRVFCKLKVAALNFVIRRSIVQTYKHSDAYVVLSRGFIDTLRQYTGLRNTPKLLSIGNPVTIPTDYSANYALSKKRQLLYVGRMDKENKRVNRIIEAWEEVAQDYKDWNLVLVGDGPHRAELESYVADHHIERVSFTGFIKEDPIEYYKDSAIFLLTSDLEGFGLVIVEAMSYAVVPIVYGSYVSVYDIIEQGKTGFITPMPYAQTETVSALRKLMDDAALRTSMGEAAQEASKSFGIEAVINQWERLFNSLRSSELPQNVGGG